MEKTNTLTVFNTCTSKYEVVEVSQEVYDEFRRGEWRISKNDDKHSANETPFSSLVGGDDDAFENFGEFVDSTNTPEHLCIEQAQNEKLYATLNDLAEYDMRLIQSIFFDGMSEREYAELTYVCRNAVHKRKIRVLRKLKKFLEFDF